MDAQHPVAPFPPSPLAGLNQAILLNIMRFSVGDQRPWYEQRDFFAFMGTCRALYWGGLHIYLGDIHVSYLPHEVERFCNFFLRNPDRARYIRVLHLTEIRFSSKTDQRVLLGRLCGVIRSAQSLKTLDITYSECLLAADKRLVAAIQSLENLEQLRFRDMGWVALETASSLQSCPSHINLHFLKSIGYSDERLDPLPALGMYREGLTELHICRAPFECEGLEFPKVRTLEIKDTPTGLLGPMVTAFPNLEVLHLVNCHKVLPSSLEHSRQAGRSIANSWANLRELFSDVYTAYSLGINTHIETWRTDLKFPKERDMFHAILEDLHPSHLNVTFQIGRSVTVNTFAEFLPRWSVIRLNMRLNMFVSEMNQAALLKTLAPSLLQPELQFLGLNVNDGDSYFTDPNATLQGLDMQKYAYQLAQAAPHLQYALFHLSPPVADTFWKFSRAGNEIRLERADRDDVEMLDRLEWGEEEDNFEDEEEEEEEIEREAGFGSWF